MMASVRLGTIGAVVKVADPLLYLPMRELPAPDRATRSDRLQLFDSFVLVAITSDLGSIASH
jgi:hypothetical protein